MATVKNYLKRGVALFLIFALSLNSFAAIVSDNDGSAFITKAEFDSLKNSFQSQIDQYNTSIDAKIDGAIAAYLAGIKVETETIKSIFTRSWENVTLINGTKQQTYAYPNISASIGIFNNRYNEISYDDPLRDWYIGANFDSSVGTLADADIRNAYSSKGYGNQLAKMLYSYIYYNYTNASKTSQRRNLVENVVIGETPDTSKMTWAGMALNVTEMWANQRQAFFRDDPAYMRNNWDQKFVLCSACRIYVDGYISSFTDACRVATDGEFLWRPSVEWNAQRSDSEHTAGTFYKYNWGYGTKALSASAIPTVTYDKDAGGVDISYKHVLNYKSANTWEVTAKNVTNYAKFSNNNSLRTAGWVNAVRAQGNVDGNWSGLEMHGMGTKNKRGSSHIAAYRTDQPVEISDRGAGTTTEENNPIPVVGLLGDFTSNNIYQFSSGDLSDEDGKSIEPLTLQQGLPLMQVKATEKVTWEPVFDQISVSGATDVTECKIILSYKPFTDMTSVSSNNDYVKMNGVEKGDFVVTSGKKAKIVFEPDRDSYVYAKWVPNTTDTIISNNYWEVRLDIANCNTYKSVKE